MQRVAAIQMCSSHIVEDNINVAKNFIRTAASNNAQLIVLPENFAIMGLQPADKVAAKEEFGAGVIQEFLSNEAKHNNCWILGGTIPLGCDHISKVKATSLLYNNKGEMVARYDKIHLFDVDISPTEYYRESDVTDPGSELVVIETPVGKLGFGVCYDIRFPEMFRCLFNMGAEIIVLPSAFTTKTGEAHWEVLTRSCAIQNLSYLIGAAQGGTHTSGRKTHGHSLIVNPWGEIIATQHNAEPGIIYADIDLKNLHEIRKSIPIADHQRIVFDTNKLK